MQQLYRVLSLIIAISLVFGSVAMVSAQDTPPSTPTPMAEEEGDTDSAETDAEMSTEELLEEFTPSIQVRDQVFSVQDGISVVVPELFVTENGWVVIHRDDNGAPGEVLGYTFVEAGPHYEVPVTLPQDVERDVALWAMLHVDAGAAGTYEFPGADEPVQLDGEVVMAPFTALEPGIIISDQTVADSTVTVEGVVTAADSWLVIHRSENGAPGEVIGYAPVAPGVTPNVSVELSGEVNNEETLWAMLHYDLGTRGEYEFPGEDVPISLPRGVVMNWFITYIEAGDAGMAAAEATATPAPEAIEATPTPTAALEMAAPAATVTPRAEEMAEMAPDMLPVTGASLQQENTSALPWVAVILGVMVVAAIVIFRRRLV